MENKEPIPFFTTSDMPLIAFLRYNGYTVQKINKINNYKAEFIFLEVDRQLLEDFNTDKTMVEPRQFAAIMHQQMQSAKRKIKE